MSRPLFLTLDGIDGTGKSTQCQLLARWLRERGHAVVLCAEPGGTALGDRLRDILLNHPHAREPLSEAFLFMASRVQLTAEVVRPALANGKTVISDRFLLSTVVYQGHAAGLDPEMIWQLGHLATGGLKPDLTLVLDMPPDVARARRKRPADWFESRGPEFYARVRAGFLAEARQHPDTIHVVDATPSVQDVCVAICGEIEVLLGKNST